MKAKNFTYGGSIIGAYFGWILPSILDWEFSFFASFGFGILFSILGTFLGYQAYKFLLKKFK